MSCSHDRNAFVWVFDDESRVWKPTLVILRIDRAATDVKWSLDGRRFAVASSAKMVPVCMYESGNDWYVRSPRQPIMWHVVQANNVYKFDVLISKQQLDVCYKCLTILPACLLACLLACLPKLGGFPR